MTDMKHENHKLHDEGSALGWVIIIMLVIILVVASILALATGYHSRAVSNHVEKQAFYSARSVAQAIADDFTTSEDDHPIKDAILAEIQRQNSGLTPGGSVTDAALNGLVLEGLDGSMGKVTLNGSYNQVTRLLKLTVTAAKDDITDQTTVTLFNMPSGKIEGLYQGIRTGSISGYNLIESIHELGCDLWITGDTQTDLAENESSGYLGNSTSLPTIYTRGDVIESNPIKGGKCLGTVISGGPIDLSNEDNAFSIESTDNLYSLYAYGDSDLTLKGKIEIDKSTDLKKPRQFVGGQMTIAGQKISIYDEVRSSSDIYEEGAVDHYSDITCQGTYNLSTPVDNTINAGKTVIHLGTKEEYIDMHTRGVSMITTGMDDSVIAYADIYAATPESGFTGSGTGDGDIYLEAYGPIVIQGSLYATGKITLVGDVAVAGDIMAPQVEFKKSTNPGVADKEVVVKGHIYTSDFNTDFEAEGEGGSEGPGEETDPETPPDGNFYNLTPEQMQTYLKNVKFVEVIISEIIPEDEDLKISKVTSASGLKTYLYDHLMDLSDKGDEVYKIDTSDTDDEEGEYEDEDGYFLTSGAVADTYMLLDGNLELSGYEGYAGTSGKPNGYIVLNAGSLNITPTYDDSGNIVDSAYCHGFIAGQGGSVTFGEGANFAGIIDVQSIDVGLGATLTYKDLNPDTDTVFSSGWKLMNYSN